MLIRPGSAPVWVGIAADPIVSDHSGQGAAPSSIQVPGSQLPSRAMASLPPGSHSAPTVLPMLLSRACCGVGPSSSVKTVRTKSRESLKPWEPSTHLP